MVQTTKKTAYFMTYLPYFNETKIISGTINGDIKKIKTITKRNDKLGNFYEVIDKENYVSGNCYRRESNPNGRTFSKLIDGTYVRLFH